MSEPIERWLAENPQARGLRPVELDIALDIMEKLSETKQIYIVGHDVPVSISRPVYDYLEAKRKEISGKLNVPEVEFEFEDTLAILCGFFDLFKPRATPEVLDQAKVQMFRWVK